MPKDIPLYLQYSFIQSKHSHTSPHVNTAYQCLWAFIYVIEQQEISTLAHQHIGVTFLPHHTPAVHRASCNGGATYVVPFEYTFCVQNVSEWEVEYKWHINGISVQVNVKEVPRS